MSKKHPKKVGKTPKETVVVNQSKTPHNNKPKTPKERGIGEVVMANVLVAIALVMILIIGKKNDVGYTFMWDTLIQKNMETIKENSELSDDEKNTQRFGGLYKYFADIKAKTPENAIIIMPADSSIDKMDAKYNMEKIKDYKYANFFLYPRIPVYENRKEDAALIAKAEYVAIFAGDGYNRVANPPEERNPFTVIKIK